MRGRKRGVAGKMQWGGRKMRGRKNKWEYMQKICRGKENGGGWKEGVRDVYTMYIIIILLSLGYN